MQLAAVNCPFEPLDRLMRIPWLQDVEELARQRLKVQLENLCQFLPQDKVGC